MLAPFLQKKMETPVGKYDEEEERWDSGDEEEHPEEPTIDLFIFFCNIFKFTTTIKMRKKAKKSQGSSY